MRSRSTSTLIFAGEGQEDGALAFLEVDQRLREGGAFLEKVDIQHGPVTQAAHNAAQLNLLTAEVHELQLAQDDHVFADFEDFAAAAVHGAASVSRPGHQ